MNRQERIAARIAADRLSAYGVPVRRVDADWHLVAKAKYLKAIDWTIGLLKTTDIGPTDVPVNEIMRRLVDLRRATQEGFRLDTLKTNLKIRAGKGQEILAAVAKRERDLLPDEKDFAAFMQPFPDKSKDSVLKQSVWLERLIAKRLAVPAASVHDRVMGEQAFMMEAFASVYPEISKVYSQIVSKVKPDQHRMKSPKSAWGKQHRKKAPFYELADLIGARFTSSSVREMAAKVAKAQEAFDVVRKTNYYLMGQGYNAINYRMKAGDLMWELQVKTEMGAAEAALSHNLIYEPDKQVAKLNDEQKKLIKLVIDTSTQFSMREWEEFIGAELKTAGFRPTASSEVEMDVFALSSRIQLFG